jgi:nifR3 family TIM-barrel protein
MSNFWLKLKKPFLVLAPMEDVTDYVFREIIGQIAKPDVFFTEFTSADGLFSKGHEVVIRKLKFSSRQRPIVAQIWGKNPETIFKASKLVKDLKFDGVDVNMGCPDRSIVRHGAGGGLIGNYNLTKEVIDAAKKGSGNLPISVKTRLGLDTIITNEWISFLLEQRIDALTIHGRTVRQMSKGEANWLEVEKAVKIKNKKSPAIIIIGNGDIISFQQAQDMHKKYGVDGIMIGRGVFTNPWIFKKQAETRIYNRIEYIEILRSHLKLQDETWHQSKNFNIMKKFFKMYIRDFEGANELRQELMTTANSKEVKQILLAKFKN